MLEATRIRTYSLSCTSTSCALKYYRTLLMKNNKHLCVCVCGGGGCELLRVFMGLSICLTNIALHVRLVYSKNGFSISCMFPFLNIVHFTMGTPIPSNHSHTKTMV